MVSISSGVNFVQFSPEDTDQPITQRFEKVVGEYSRNIAIKTPQRQLTYDELNILANRLARLIIHQSPNNSPVAILSNHGAPAIIAILAALKASTTFLCLDPALPGTRIEQILNDSGSDLIITNDECLNPGVELSDNHRRVINMDHCDDSIPSANLNLKSSPDSVAYILYTSGSTGKPKGVLRTHRIDLRNIRHVTNTLRITNEDRITLLGSYSTGQGMTDTFCALLNGAILLPRNLKTDGFHRLADWLIQEKITFYHSAATIFRHFTGGLRSGEIFPDLRIIRLGAEAVSWKDVELYKKHFSDTCLLANELSCSEASTYSQFLINKQTEIHEVVPVGYPVEGKEILVLDESGNLLGAGEVGEIAVRSRSLSPGYWRSPDLTNLSFYQDKNDPDYRIYKTGDLGRKSSDGCLEHLGRKDGQVQIRGHRVECREIELALLHDPTVDQAFVVHGQDSNGETYLTAYIVCHQGKNPTVTEIRARLRQRLPNFMVPAGFMILDTLPLTVTGKIDRGALPKPSSTRPALETFYVAPRNPIEKNVATMCSEILNITDIGVDDNIFDLGGHSISAMQIVERVIKTFEIDVPLKGFYDSPTIAGLSALIALERADRKPEAALSLGVSALHRMPRPGFILSSIAQEPMLRLEEMFSGLGQFNVPSAYRVEGPLNVDALKQSLVLLVDRHESLRTRFRKKNGKHYQDISVSPFDNFEFIDLRESSTTERESYVRELFREETRRLFDLADGPLLRVKLFRLRENDYILAITLHQLVSDGQSMGIFLHDLAEFYRSILQANPSQLPNLPIQFADYSIWQREALKAGLMDKQLCYWKNQLSEPLIPLEFSKKVRRQDESEFFTSRKEISISSTVYQLVKSLAREEKTTSYIVLLTALKILLFRYLNRPDIRVATLAANRHRSEVENLIGHFVNTLIVRANVAEQITFREFAELIKKISVAAFSNQDLPFEALLESLEKDCRIQIDMLAPVLFIFQSAPKPITMPGLRFSALDDFQTTATPEVTLTKFDLVISLKENTEELTGFLVYKISLFDEIMIDGFIRNFESLLAQIVDNPNQSLSNLRRSLDI
jgi:amino acid adenylation domain-containing protein